MPIANDNRVCVYLGEGLARYAFPGDHPFGGGRMEAFWDEMMRNGLDGSVTVRAPVMAAQEAIERFHTHTHVERVKAMSARGVGTFDDGDTPAFSGVYEAAAYVVGSTVDAVKRIMERACRRAFVPIAGLHHAARDAATGFCIFNDIGVVIETLRSGYGVRRIAYVDIDAHHGDGVFYAYEADPQVFIVDVHEDGRYLFPGTGAAHETGRGAAAGSKLNIPMPPGAGDSAFLQVWPRIEAFVRYARPEFIILQCGADSLAGDPLANLRYSPASHAHAGARLCEVAEECCEGRVLALGGGGYNLDNLARAWTAVVRALIETP
ncbi:MAG: acetoin utilization protein AcuC [Gammaproteobacteria bacterium]|nr:acetoin utilization protein AcuC [Gammaproteobacteria bacterium]